MQWAIQNDPLESFKAEINEAIESQRAAFPNDDETTMRHRAEMYRPHRYEEGRWPDWADVARKEGQEAAAQEAAATATICQIMDSKRQ
jgi:hypothetical protein